MKMYITKTKMITLALAAMFLMSATSYAFAKGDDKDKKANIEYVGELNQLPIYKLSLKNPSNETFYLSITNSKDKVIYTDMLTGANIIRNYQITGVTSSDLKVTFTIKNAKGEKVSLFSINGDKELVSEIKESATEVALNNAK